MILTSTFSFTTSTKKLKDLLSTTLLLWFTIWLLESVTSETRVELFMQILYLCSWNFFVHNINKEVEGFGVYYPLALVHDWASRVGDF